MSRLVAGLARVQEVLAIRPKSGDIGYVAGQQPRLWPVLRVRQAGDAGEATVVATSDYELELAKRLINGAMSKKFTTPF